MSNKPVIVLGAGGHAKVCIDVLKRCDREIVGIAALVSDKTSVLGIKIIGDDSEVLNYAPEDIELVNGIGQLPGKTTRYNVYGKFKGKGYQFATLIHPSAIVAENVILHEGVQIMAGAVIQPATTIGEDTIINTRVTIDHDCTIGQHCHVAPGAILSGGVHLARNVFVGTGVSIIQNITIEECATIAAGSVVYKSIKADSVSLPQKNKEKVL